MDALCPKVGETGKREREREREYSWKLKVGSLL
jgi:hypothetical protein